MRFNFYNKEFEILEEWIVESGFTPLKQNRCHYVFDKSNKEIFLVKIDCIWPKIRAAGVDIFKAGEVDGELISARDRTVSILKAIVDNMPLPPVKVIDFNSGQFKYKLVAGCHRLHCSIAAGFTHIPSVYDFDINNL